MVMMVRATAPRPSEVQVSRSPQPLSIAIAEGRFGMYGTVSVGSGPFGGLVPLDASYARLPIAQAFNWSECLASVEHGEWYVVSFRSVRRLGSDDALLEEFDRRAFAEASGHSGLSCYFIGE